MTRVRARVIETEVDSFLFELHSNSHESWVLPQTEVLCILRYQGDDRETVRTKTPASTEQEKEERDEKNEESEFLDTPGAQLPAGNRP